MFFVGVWSSVVEECFYMGVFVSLIVFVMLEGLNFCIEEVVFFEVFVYYVFDYIDNIKIFFGFEIFSVSLGFFL